MGSPLTFHRFDRELNSYASQQDLLLVAISGGMDSVALLHLASQFIRSDHDIYAVHVNHGFRDASNLEEQFVKELCKSLDIPLSIHRADTPQQKGESIEMWARRIRQSAFASAQEKFNCDWILTAHHANDNVETILMHLDNGCGIEGLRGIPKQNGNILRPLLNFSREDISEYVRENGLNYVEDSSNKDTSIRRNHIRYNVVKPWKEQTHNIIQRFSALSFKASYAVQRMNEVINLLAEKVKSNNHRFIIEDNVMNCLIGNQKVRLVKQLMGETERAWRRHGWTSIENWMAHAETGSIFQINGKWSILRDRNQWVLKQETMGHDGYRLSLNSVDGFKENHNHSKEIIDGRTLEGKDIQLRPWHAGDQFNPLGMNGTKKVSDFLIDKKVDRFTKENQLVVTADGEIIWVCGQRISEKAKVTEKTTEFVELSLERELG